MYSAIWAYPWDCLDEGIETAVGRIADAGLNAISVAAAYHTVRALCPHNPKHTIVHGEGGVAYFRHNPAHFPGLLQPCPSALAAESDPLEIICLAAGKRGLKVHAWTVLHHNTRLGHAHPECTIVNAFGDGYPFGLCPAHPEVRAYSLGIVKSLAERSNLDTIELESLGYMGIDHTGHHSKAGLDLDAAHRFLLSLCFCASCAKYMADNGVDVAKARADTVREIRDYLGGHFRAPGDDPIAALTDVFGKEQLDNIFAARDEVVLTLLEELYWQVRDKQKLSVMVSGSPLSTGAQLGVTLTEARQWTDRLLTQAFFPSARAIRTAVADVSVRRGSTPVFAGLQAMHPFVNSAQELTERVAAAMSGGAEGVQFYHYGLMPLANLSWVYEALAAA